MHVYVLCSCHRDKAIFGLLAKCVQSSSDISESLKAREELTRKLDSKSALSDYLSLVFDFASFSIDNAAVVSSLTENLCKQNPILGKLGEFVVALYKYTCKPIAYHLGFEPCHLPPTFVRLRPLKLVLNSVTATILRMRRLFLYLIWMFGWGSADSAFSRMDRRGTNSSPF